MPYILHSYLNGEGADQSTFTDGMPMSDSSLLNDTQFLELHIEANKKYRLRIANVGTIYTHYIAFGEPYPRQWRVLNPTEGHRMLIVAIDGVPIRPTPAETISIAVGQRYDVIIQGRRNPSQNHVFIAYQPDKHEEVTGLLVYDEIFEPPDPWIWTEPPLDDMYLQPLDTTLKLSKPDREFEMPLYMTRQRRVFMNGYPYVQPFVPTLFSALSTGKMATSESVYGHGVNPIILRQNEIIRIEVTNHDPLPRPVSRTAGRGSR
jgi:iron transport multicopper oxidase